MNTIRMFAFAAAILITAALFAVIADSFESETPVDAATAAHAPADRASP
ncbi:MAG TPA: hypothetical protein VGE92_09460 [Steroidobacteraceae bacterium]|jgi:hypothetical protein